MGLIAGIELVTNKASRENFDPSARAALELEMRCLGHGLIVRAIGDTIAISPPLIITADEVADLLTRLETGIAEFCEGHKFAPNAKPESQSKRGTGA
jgi:4-aminobutyrate--pyruvate transaminase